MSKKFLVVCWLLLFSVGIFAETPANFKRTEDVIYGRKFGTALTLDVFKPAKPNGYGIVFMVSGGWFSAHEAIKAQTYEAFLDRGYTVFAVVHGSQPKFQIPEVIEDVQRAVRFIRHNAKKYGVDPDKLGVSGGSAGGHLSLILATKGGPGPKDAKDPIDRESSAVQCVACFFPPTDFLNYGDPGTNAVGVGILKDFQPAFGPEAKTEEGRQKLGREISPIYFVHTNQAPILILHGDADKLVPIQQAETFLAASEKVGGKTKLVVKKGGGHGWADWTKDFALFTDWFDEQLRGIKPKE
ncbi:MAG: Prolyl oligopeptidase family protein [Verrucomicrobiales bacterium]|nr:Prolyl oligopeptidase family protein [Verrucomicrobiales bacterium]